MLANGDADIDNSGGATLFDAGAIGSGYSTFPTNILDATGAALNAGYEASSTASTVPEMITLWAA